MHFRRRTTAVVIAATLITGACIVSSTTRSSDGDKSAAPGTVVKSPVRAHMLDGSVAIFRGGITFAGDNTITGAGERYPATRTGATPVQRLPLDSVIGFEVFDREENPGRTVLYSTAATLSTIALALVVFGSCPTIYADSAGHQTLQAESFSYSIAPLLAKRDLDRLSAQADANGVVRLVVKNEALETHYLDQLELVELRHRADELVLPAPRTLPLALSGIVAPSSIRDAAGRDLRAALVANDGFVFATDSSVLTRAIAGGATEDYVELSVPRVKGRDTLALVLRARASLLTSAVLYDYMLARPGPAALDWLGRDMGRITTVAQVAKWYAENFGMRVQVLDHGQWRQVSRLMDFGPAAWRDVGIRVPAVGTDSVRVRLSFAADEFHIDRLAVAWNVRHLEPRAVTLTRVLDASRSERPDAAAMLARADERKLVTNPGDRFIAEFDAGVADAGTRTFMLATQGYYVEWIRPSWFRADRPPTPFAPSKLRMRDLLESWREAKDTLEDRFFVRRVPVV
jgi:hypothetical protein